MYICSPFSGEMAEWSKAAVSKTVKPLSGLLGFESPSLRHGLIAAFYRTPLFHTIRPDACAAPGCTLSPTCACMYRVQCCAWSGLIALARRTAAFSPWATCDYRRWTCFLLLGREYRIGESNPERAKHALWHVCRERKRSGLFCEAKCRSPRPSASEISLVVRLVEHRGIEPMR